MELVVEPHDTQEKALFVRQNTSPFSKHLLSHLASYDIHTTETSSLPYSFRDIDYLFIIGDAFTEGELRQIFESDIKTLIVTSEKKVFNEFRELIARNARPHVKIVLASEDEIHSDIIERILWFMLTRSEEMSLNVRHSQNARRKRPASQKRSFKLQLTRKRLMLAGLFIVIMLHTLFVLPLLGTTYFIYAAGRHVQDQRIEPAPAFTLARTHRATGKQQFGRPTLADNSRQHCTGTHVCTCETNAHKQECGFRARRSVTKVTGHGDSRSRTGTDAIDGADDRLRTMPNSLDEVTGHRRKFE